MRIDTEEEEALVYMYSIFIAHVVLQDGWHIAHLRSRQAKTWVEGQDSRSLTDDMTTTGCVAG